MSDTHFDLVVIGAGPAGYVAAIRASQLGMKTACIEKWDSLGGTCLNIGCIPSKALLDSSEHFEAAAHKYSKHGIEIGQLKLNLAQMMKRKDGVVRQLTQGVGFLFKKNKIQRYQGHGKIVATGKPHRIAVEGKDNLEITATQVLIATGSVPTELPFLKFDEKRILSSTGALSIPEVPKHLVVIGGGVIGLELGSVWRRLGAKVTVVEFQDHILGSTDRDSANDLMKALQKQGMEFLLSCKCLGATEKSGQLLIDLEDLKSKDQVKLECDYVLVSTGRRPYTDKLGLENTGIQLDKMGRIPINSHFETSVPGIYAVGDVVAGAMLAHKAEEEGIAAVEIMAGQAGHVNYETIPSVVYTWPELASVGASEEQLKEAGIPYKKGSFPFMANGRAKAMDEVDGKVKILAHQETDRVLGAHIVGPWASDLIGEMVAFMEFGASAEDVARTCHSHPTLSEVIKEAALAVDKRQIHL